MNLRSKPKAKAVAPRAALKMEPTVPTPPPTPGNSNLSEVALRKLPRAELQKLAMAHKVRANMKSELIIQQLLSLQLPKKTRPAEDDPEQGPSRKRFKSEAEPDEVSVSPASENHVAPLDTQPTTDASGSRLPEDGPSTSRSISPAHKEPTVLSYDKDLFSSTESEMTEEEQLDFATPVSSRSGTPPAANVLDLERCVTIMQEISAQDVTLLKEVAGVCETAVKLRKRARDVRDLVKAERGRRERMEAYFRYWQEIEPRWDRKWLYGEKMVPEYKIKLNDLDKPAGPPTIPARQYTGVNGERPAILVPVRKPMLSPEELKKRREAIISKQEAEQRELEALRRSEGSSRQGSSEAAGMDSLGEGSSITNPPPVDENTVKERLMISFGGSMGTMALTVPAMSP